MLKIILIGPPGAGKGTQAEKISRFYSIPHISTGEMFREMYNKKDPLGMKAHDEYWGKGLLVPDSIVVDMVKERLKQDDCSKGYILDGFPRTLEQAEALDEFEVIDYVLEITSSDDTIINRLSQRLQCPKCKRIYGIDFPPKVDNLCDVCKVKLVHRPDDNPEVIKRRLEVYHKQTKPLLDYYKKKELLHTIDGEQEPDKVFEKIRSILKI